jgi:branched-chain amino acid aminotransferase
VTGGGIFPPLPRQARASSSLSMIRESPMGVSFDKIDGVIWYDGRLVPWADANVHILTHGLHYASCVLEGERAYGGKVFKSTAHSERLKNSANILDFEIPWSVAEIDAANSS